MKKIFFFAAMAAVALASCSNDEVVQTTQTSPTNEIGFRTFVSSTTRSNANDLSVSNLSEFYVTAQNSELAAGTEYFGATTPVRFYAKNSTVDADHPSTGQTYVSDTKYYWPSTGKLDFFAFSPAVVTGEIVRTDSTTFTITPNDAAASQKDFLYAVTRSKVRGTYSDANYGNVTTLNFRHAESKVIIQLKNTATDMTITVKDVTIGNVLNSGTFHPIYKTSSTGTGFSYNGTTYNNTTDASSGYYISPESWSNTGATATTYQQTVTGSPAAFTSATETTALPQDFILVPQALMIANEYASGDANALFNGAYIKVALKIQDSANHYIVGTEGSANNTYVEALWPLATVTSWLPGHKYTYTVELSGGGYFPTNQDGTDKGLDPILKGAVIQFVGVSVDEWIPDGTETLYDTGLPTPTN